MINRKIRFNPISIFDLQSSISNIRFEQASMSLSILFIFVKTDIVYGFIIVAHTEILWKLHIISIQTFV